MGTGIKTRKKVGGYAKLNYPDLEVEVKVGHRLHLHGEVQPQHHPMQELQHLLLDHHLDPLPESVPPFKKSPHARRYMNLKLKILVNSALKKETL